MLRMRHPAWRVSAIFFVPAFIVACESAESGSSTSGGYGLVVPQLERFITREIAAREMPALSIALVAGDEIVWAGGFGEADPATSKRATEATVYRVGSVSKLLTDIALMRLVERGSLDVDAEITTYLPEFRPSNPFGRAITLRQLMSHRSGLVREPAIGSYFDPTEPDLAATVESLNATQLVYPPGSRTKYSNAGVSVAGFVLERTQGVPFSTYMRREILTPMGLSASSFELEPELRQELARASMWTYDGRLFAAPVFQLGTAPAGNLYSTVVDMARFIKVLIAGGRGPGGQIVRRETLEAMFTPAPGEDFGIGFHVSSLGGERRVGHSGAVYGYSTVLSVLPDAKLGVVVVASLDMVHGALQRITDHALAAMLALKRGERLPELTFPGAIDATAVRALAGTYRRGESGFTLERRGNRLFLDDERQYFVALGSAGDFLVPDDRLSHAMRIRPVSREGELAVGDATYRRVEAPEPIAVPERWKGLLGEYGWDHNILYILEKNGRLHALIEWFFSYPLEEISENVFAFPDYGLYHGEQLIFRRDDAGTATSVIAANVEFARRSVGAREGETFRIELREPVPQLRRRALAAAPPREERILRRPDLVELSALDPSIRYDIRYAGSNNFMGASFYRQSRAFLQRPAAEAVARAHRALKPQGYGLLIHDAYRPWHVTRMFWDATPEDMRAFVANPARGSRHNRGCAVDLTLYDIRTGAPVQMVSGYDEFTARAHPFYPGGTTRQRRLRALLRETMESVGFTVYELEWWHFDFKDWREYPILNHTFEEILDPKP